MIQELHNQAIKRLRENGVKKRLWLVEVQKIEAAAALYGDYILTDHTADKPEDHDSIIYYHESGAINQHATFNKDNQASFNEAVDYIGEYLGGY
ncbi:MAG: hypothetical protein ACOCQA_01705 [bacterium]